jgi:hypothetical protein
MHEQATKWLNEQERMRRFESTKSAIIKEKNEPKVQNR